MAEEGEEAVPRRPGRERKVYLRPDVDGALEAYRDDVTPLDGKPPAVNAILLGLLEAFLIDQGYLLPRKMNGRKQSHKEST